jgi:protein phosphatase
MVPGLAPAAEPASPKEAPPVAVPVAVPVESASGPVPVALPVEPAPAAVPLAVPVAVPAEPAVPVAAPATPTAEAGEPAPPVAVPAEAEVESPVAEADASAALAPPAEVSAEEPLALEEETPAAEPSAEAEPVALEEPAAPPAEPVAAPLITCPVCSAPNPKAEPSCHDCGYYFSAADLNPDPNALPAAAAPAAAPVRLQGRYELLEQTSERQGVQRYRGLDHADAGPPVPVVIVRQALPALAEPAEAVPAEAAEESGEEILPTFDETPPASSPTVVLSDQPAWPSIGWERHLLRTLEHPGLPAERAYFSEDGCEYLVLEAPAGQTLWDAWDDPEATARERFGLLGEVAEVLARLHQCNALVEGLRPDIFVNDEGRARLADLSDLLPLPVPADVAVRGSLYTAPELLGGSGQADARADLYSFGAMVYALHLGRELTEAEFDKGGAGYPRPILAKFPDMHPTFARLLMKTFRREVDARFPTDEAGKEDATGFAELMRTLEVLGRTSDDVRLEIASWTTTGMVRTGNEDAFALLHASESRQDDVADSALVLLCDGMGGYEAGEVAAALAIKVLRQTLVQQEPFNAAAGASGFATDPLTQMARPEGHAKGPLDVEATKQKLKAALKEANKQVFQASRAPGSKRRGMGCTAEAVYVDSRNIVVGHVGDSRTYHLHEGRLIQLTRDQTLVNRLVELGTLSAEEAESHPRRNELQQAIGGQPDVEPGLYQARLKPGDWVVVCSDGLSNHITPKDLALMLQREAESAQMAARRLVNLVNIEGATDNATVVVIRAT